MGHQPQGLELATRRARRIANRQGLPVSIFELKPTPRTLSLSGLADALLGLLTGRPKPTSGYALRTAGSPLPDNHDGLVAVIQPVRPSGYMKPINGKR